MAEKKQEFFLYKNRPLVRKGNTLYYGSLSDPYVVMMQIHSNAPFADLELADKVTVQLMLTDSNVKPQDCIVKRSEKNGLYNAIDIASIWLERALGENESQK